MNTSKWTKIALGSVAALVLTAGVHAQKGQMNCTPGTGGKMQCGMDMAPSKPLSSVPGTKNMMKITATMSSPAKAGDNVLNIVLKNAAGKPITAAKITAQAAMTSMDMGTTDLSVKEIGKGHYTTTATFSMAGPWRVTVKIAAAGLKPQTKAFDFMAN